LLQAITIPQHQDDDDSHDSDDSSSVDVHMVVISILQTIKILDHPNNNYTSQYATWHDHHHHHMDNNNTITIIIPSNLHSFILTWLTILYDTILLQQQLLIPQRRSSSTINTSNNKRTRTLLVHEHALYANYPHNHQKRKIEDVEDELLVSMKQCIFLLNQLQAMICCLTLIMMEDSYSYSQQFSSGIQQLSDTVTIRLVTSIHPYCFALCLIIIII